MVPTLITASNISISFFLSCIVYLPLAEQTPRSHFAGSVYRCITRIKTGRTKDVCVLFQLQVPSRQMCAKRRNAKANTGRHAVYFNFCWTAPLQSKSEYFRLGCLMFFPIARVYKTLLRSFPSLTSISRIFYPFYFTWYYQSEMLPKLLFVALYNPISRWTSMHTASARSKYLGTETFFGNIFRNMFYIKFR